MVITGAGPSWRSAPRAAPLSVPTPEYWFWYAAGNMHESEERTGRLYGVRHQAGTWRLSDIGLLLLLLPISPAEWATENS